MKMPYALDARTKQLRRIDEAPDGPAPEMACPACGNPLAARNASTAAGHHFVPPRRGKTEMPEPNCTRPPSRSWWDGSKPPPWPTSPLDIQTACSVCPGRCYQIIQTGGSGQQGKTGLRIRPTGMYPDVTVVDEKDRPTALIEIVDTNQPEDESDDYRTWTRLPVFIFEVKSPEDLDDLYGDTLEPAKSGNNECRCRKCGRCGFERVCGPDPEAECLVCQEEGQEVGNSLGDGEPDPRTAKDLQRMRKAAGQGRVHRHALHPVLLLHKLKAGQGGSALLQRCLRPPPLPELRRGGHSLRPGG